MTAEAEAQGALFFLRRQHRENLCPTAMLGLHITSAVRLSNSTRPVGPIPGVTVMVITDSQQLSSPHFNRLSAPDVRGTWRPQGLPA